MWWLSNKISFFDCFEQHSQEINKAAIALQGLFEGAVPNIEASLKVKEYEHRADSITHEVISQLCRSNFIPPIDHQDILHFINCLDDVLDYIDDSVEAYVEIYQLTHATPFARRLAEQIVKGAGMLVAICPLLRHPSKHSDAIRSICIEIHEIENEGDHIKKEALKDLYQHYTASKIDVAWDRLYEYLESVTDKIEDCANIADQILMKYS